MTERCFIMFGLQSWDIEIGSNFKNMAKVISENNKVLYVNRPLDWYSRIRFKQEKWVVNRMASIKKNENTLTEVQKNIWVLNPRVTLSSINNLPPGGLYNFLHKKNTKKIANEIIMHTKKLQFTNPVLIVDNDFFNGLFLKEMLAPTTFIFYIRDFLLSQKYFQRHGKMAEKAIMKKADVVLANSLYLRDYAKKINTNSFDIGQGCEVEEFMDGEQKEPLDLKNIKGKKIGYCGMLTVRRLDINLLIYIGENKPEWNIILVGPVDSEFAASKLNKMGNVHFLGAKAPEELPAYVHHFDVCMNPQLLNQMTIGNYPRKIDEYLAAGKPIVATNTEAMKYFEEVVYLCDSYDDYLRQMEIAFLGREDNDLIQKRISFAKEHTWPNSVGKLYEIINSLNGQANAK